VIEDDPRTHSLGVSKRDVLATLVNDQLNIEGETTIISGEPLDAVLNLAEAADLLRVAENYLQSLAESGEIPGRQIGDEWRFSRQALSCTGCAHNTPAAPDMETYRGHRGWGRAVRRRG
jgi:excisionase family DNA binding protein